jgi:hypothetical protein
LEYSSKKSKIFSKNVQLNIIERFFHLGYSDIEFQNGLKYLKEIQILIHFDVIRDLALILKDGYYRNQFETGKSNGALSRTDRIAWEKNLFKGIYDKSTDTEKVKYGCLNLLSQKTGVLRAYRYGNSYFVLKDHVKPRTTFVVGDSSTQQMHLATFKYSSIILNLVDDALLKQIIYVSNKINEKIKPLYPYNYIEAQIHGPLNIFTDIEKIVLNKIHTKNIEILELLTHFGIQYEFM